MSKSKVYKKKKNGGANIFAILAGILAVLIVFAIVFSVAETAKYNGILEDYVEFEYGEKKNVKLEKGIDSTTGITVYANDDYAYYVDDNIIFDLAKKTTTNEAFTAKAKELGADFGEFATLDYTPYIEGNDFSKVYGYIQVVASYEGTTGGEEAVAEKIWGLVDSLNEEYSICGMYLTYSETDALYYVVVDLTDREPVTLEKIKENMSTIPLNVEATEVETEGEAEAENAEGETAE